MTGMQGGVQRVGDAIGWDGLFLCTLVPGKEQIFVSFGDVAVHAPLSALVG